MVKTKWKILHSQKMFRLFDGISLQIFFGKIRPGMDHIQIISFNRKTIDTVFYLVFDKTTQGYV